VDQKTQSDENLLQTIETNSKIFKLFYLNIYKFFDQNITEIIRVRVDRKEQEGRVAGCFGPTAVGMGREFFYLSSKNAGFCAFYCDKLCTCGQKPGPG